MKDVVETIEAADRHSVGAQHQKIAKGASLRSRMRPYRQVVIMTKFCLCSLWGTIIEAATATVEPSDYAAPIAPT